MKYASTALASLFAATDEWSPTVALAVYGSEPVGLGLGGLQTLEQAFQRFQVALASATGPSRSR